MPNSKGTSSTEEGWAGEGSDVRPDGPQRQAREVAIQCRRYFRLLPGRRSLVIPDKILGKKLSKKDKEQLLAGEVVPVRIRDKDIFLQVDRDLNSVIARSNQELKIPQVIGKTDEYEGYKLTKSDELSAGQRAFVGEQAAAQQGRLLYR